MLFVNANWRAHYVNNASSSGFVLLTGFGSKRKYHFCHMHAFTYHLGNCFARHTRYDGTSASKILSGTKGTSWRVLSCRVVPCHATMPCRAVRYYIHGKLTSLKAHTLFVSPLRRILTVALVVRHCKSSRRTYSCYRPVIIHHKRKAPGSPAHAPLVSITQYIPCITNKKELFRRMFRNFTVWNDIVSIYDM